jgi:Toastrack DUF4097
MTEHRFHTPDGLRLDVNIPFGKVNVESHDGDESVVVVEGSDRLVEQTHVELKGDRLVVSLEGKKVLGISGWFADLSFGGSRLVVDVSVPHGSDAVVSTASGDIRTRGRLGSLEVRTASGDLTVEGEVEGDTVVRTVSGDVRIARVGGSLRCQTVSGDLDVGSVDGSVDMKSVSGDLRCQRVLSGDATFTSVSGDVRVGIAAGSFLDVDAGSVSGDLSSEVELASVRSDMGTGPTVVLRGKTISGDVRVFRTSA